MTWLLPRIETTQGRGRKGARKGMDRAMWQRASAWISLIACLPLNRSSCTALIADRLTPRPKEV